MLLQNITYFENKRCNTVHQLPVLSCFTTLMKTMRHGRKSRVRQIYDSEEKLKLFYHVTIWGKGCILANFLRYAPSRIPWIYSSLPVLIFELWELTGILHVVHVFLESLDSGIDLSVYGWRQQVIFCSLCVGLRPYTYSFGGFSAISFKIVIVHFSANLHWFLLLPKYSDGKRFLDA